MTPDEGVSRGELLLDGRPSRGRLGPCAEREGEALAGIDRRKSFQTTILCRPVYRGRLPVTWNMVQACESYWGYR